MDNFNTQSIMLNPFTLKNNLHELMTKDDSSSDYEADEHVDINDYECASDMNVLNILICHYKQLCATESLEPENVMEYIHTETQKYEMAIDDDKDVLYDVDDDVDTSVTLYCILIDAEPVYISKYVITLVNYLCTTEWYKINWSIITL